MEKDKKHIRILYASRLVHEKGIDILIRLIEAVNRSSLGEYIDWVICGDGEYIQDIVHITDTYKNVQYLGRINSADMRKEYEKSDFLYMPSRFLETFGLTALESLMHGTPVIGMRKGGLETFIPEVLAIDDSDPVVSSYKILEDIIDGRIVPEIIDVSDYQIDAWKERVKKSFPDTHKILLVHDYEELIGGAEYYIAFLRRILSELGIEVRLVAYTGHTTPWKRRWMFIFSFLAFWRGINIRKELEIYHPDTIWMHSVLRYHGPWSIYQIQGYCDKNSTSSFLSHHDLGLITPFPSSIYNETDIPADDTLGSFLPHKISYTRIFAAACKWGYIRLMRSCFPSNMKHIIFSAFLEKYISNHFHGEPIILLPHTVTDL